jgi:hypothetical protein
LPLPPIVDEQEEPRTQAEVALAALVHLTRFDRFVYLMSVLEGYTDRDSVTQLGRSSADVAEALLRALQQVRQ